VAVARWSASGEAGQRVLARRDPRLSPLVAATLAHHGLNLPEPQSNVGWLMSI